MEIQTKDLSASTGYNFVPVGRETTAPNSSKIIMKKQSGSVGI